MAHRRLTTTTRIIRYGFNSFSRNTWLTTAATAVMTVTLSLILLTVMTRFIFNDTISQVRQKLDVSVYLVDTITPQQLNEFTREIKAVSGVESVTYVSKDEAEHIFQQQNSQNFSELQALGALGNNPFPASLRIRTVDPNHLGPLDTVINSPRNKSLQSDAPSNSGERKQVIDNIARVSQFLQTAGLVAAFVFVLISIMIIFNTIRMAIFNRRDEIEVMKLIGAQKRFIRGPFIVEAALYGVIAAVVSIVLIYAFVIPHVGVLSKYEIVVDSTVNFFRTWPVLIIAGQAVVGMLIGVFSAYLAIRRYLKL